MSYGSDSENESEQVDRSNECNSNSSLLISADSPTKKDCPKTNDADNLDPATVERIKHYHELKQTSGFDLMENIKSKKEFGNPQILHKVIDHYHINQVNYFFLYK